MMAQVMNLESKSVIKNDFWWRIFSEFIFISVASRIHPVLNLKTDVLAVR